MMKTIKMTPLFSAALSLALFTSFVGLIPLAHAEGRTVGSTFTDCPVCPEMVVLPAGEFVQGSDKVESGHVDEKPQRTVKIADRKSTRLNSSH